jgi:hypothetical protein
MPTAACLPPQGIAVGGLAAEFGIVMREKRINPFTATSVISFAALLTYAPLYLLFVGVDRDRERERHREHLFMERHCWKSCEAFRGWLCRMWI